MPESDLRGGEGRGDEEEEMGEVRTKSREERGGAPPRRRNRLCPLPTFFLLSFQAMFGQNEKKID